MRRVSRTLIVVIAAVLIFALVWPKVRIVFLINLSLWQAMLIFGLAVLVVFLVLDHFLNRSRD
jgi:hypothetical protein